MKKLNISFKQFIFKLKEKRLTVFLVLNALIFFYPSVKN